jgi:TRAP-type C4-dicarboxylate transport system substrate-binding protein
MIDSLISTSLATVALQWHSKLNHVTSETSGVLLGAMIVNKKKWDSIPEDVRKTLDEQIRKNTEGDSKTVRKNDLKSYKKLLKRGYTATKYTGAGQKEWDKMAATVRKRMTGRVYPKDLLARVQKIASGG